MAFSPTKMQKMAIETDGNILVSAAAGSGKTAVLVERVIRKLTDPVNPISADRLLIVTFTNAAAAEMRSRIEKRLNEEAAKHPDDIALLKQRHLIAFADICTIDSFCIKLVRENFEKCGVEPDFKVSDGSTQTSLSSLVMSQIMGEQFLLGDGAFNKLLELTGCEYDEKNLADTIERLYLYSRQLPFPENFLNNLALPYKENFTTGNAWYDAALQLAKIKLDEARSYVEKMAQAAMYVQKNSDKCIAYSETTSRIIDELFKTASGGNWDEFYDLVHSASLKSVPAASKEDHYADIFKDNKKQVSNTIKQLCEIFSQNREGMENTVRSYLPAVNKLIELINDYGKRLFEAFKSENSFTFYNTEQMALNLLCKYENGEVVMREEGSFLAQRYDEVLVDEFQDVNDLQNMLFYVLSNYDEKLFVVGDVKQSIYGFRGSNPDNFLNKKQSYLPIEEASGKEGKKIILSDNFRSRKGVCETVNFLFSLLMAGQRGKIIYDKDERLNAAGEFPESDAPAAELLVVDMAESESDDSLLENEARAIAEYILSVMNEGAVISDNGTLRNAKYSDFAILLDKIKDKASVIAEILTSYGIPVGFSAQGFLETTEISTVMSLLQVIDNPQNDVELLCVMMSPIFGFTAEEMADIRAAHKKGNIYSAVISAAANGNQKAAKFLEDIAELRRQATALPLDRLISLLINSTDILNLMSAMSGGRQRAANLFSLIKYASDYSAGGRNGIYGFIRYINSLPETSFKSASLGGENCVKLMSMHNSKGLQFPVCIIANLASQINNADSIGRVLFSEKLGIAFKYFDEETALDTRLLGHALISNEAAAKTLEERMRLLYVALTRAQDRLCMVCSLKDAEKRLKKINNSLSADYPYITGDFLDSSRTMGDWILAAALLHPDCDKLRYIAESNIEPINAAEPLKLTYINRVGYASTNNSERTTEFAPNAEYVKEIAENMEFVYPGEELRFIQAKSSVSAIANSAESERFAFTEKPAFMLKNGISATERGTATHAVMQFVNMDGKPDIAAELERLVEWQFITEQQAQSVDVKAINAFFDSALYERIMRSKEFRREMRFLTEVEAGKLDASLSDSAKNAKIIVQGAVDLCFVEDDGVVVLDFKTDRVDSMTALAESYSEQLGIYAKACEKIFGKPVKEKILYSFCLSESISF